MNETGSSNKISKRSKQRTVAVVGLGYVGLPLALLFVERGFRVIGIDVNVQKIERLKQGKSYISDINDEAVQLALEKQSFAPSADYSMLPAAEAIVICVPTPLTASGTPDLSCLTQAAAEISTRLMEEQLVILESSTYPGTTKEVLLPLLLQSGLVVGESFHLAYSPERVDPGNESYSVQDIPKVVSGVTVRCLQRVEELYKQLFAAVHPVSSTETAEMTKILENAYRLINISFIYEMAMICDVLELNVWEIIEAASTKPFGYKAFYPGPGIGGHCIPVDPAYLEWKINQLGMQSDFIRLSNAINHRMPIYIVQQLKLHFAPKPLSDVKIFVYGAAYKPDIADCRESASIELLHLLQLEGAAVTYHDPYVPSLHVGEQQLTSTELNEATLKASDCFVIATNHSSLPLSLVLEHASLIYDTRHATRATKDKTKIIMLGGGGK
ncbi:nucleotide sugar dehydrogenase [Paenibacillus luteus]|uniref:nucleotide sugar dehydrogenase n=1 Tax=Paenibacillus luteus TaxID=2545753 RepID=UPI0011445D0F|nr:nucleotide sugar dehydrogenase [Paenibacillus luteus]